MEKKETTQQAPEGYITLRDLIRTAYQQDRAKHEPPPEAKEKTLAFLREKIAEKNAE